MARIDVQEDLGSWMQLQPAMGAGLVAFSEAVYGKASLPLRVREIARMRIAQINQCEVCRNARQQHGSAQGVDEALYSQVEDWRTAAGYSEPEKLAAEFAERFALDHVALRADDAFWQRFRAAYSDAEIVELSMSIALWLGSGRAMRVLDVGQACELTLQSPG
ncbi:MAG TPA: carboxymuconolactone decarboxylase family protein [Solimonas sp.]|nr:carboxymuconolactone decarboxylase family protein [Solimonas sp.]